MTEPADGPWRWWKFLLVTGSIGLIAVLAALWYTTTDSFQAYVRRRMVAELERLSGGRAEIGSFHIVPFRMQVEVRDITVHGKEGLGELPLAHADHLYAHMKVDSFLRTEFGFHSLSLEHPVVHIVIGRDGSTNVPALGLSPVSRSNPIEQLFALSIDRLSVSNGELLWGDQKIPLDFDVHDANLQMDYSFLRGRYDCRLALGKVDSMFQGFRPFAWTTTAEFSLEMGSAYVKRLTWSSGRSSMELSGRITDFRNPQLAGSYNAHADLEEVAAIARRHDLREGIAELKGTGHWSLNNFLTRGTLALRDVSWQDDRIALKKADADADYSVTDQQMTLSKLQGRLFGGAFTGDAQVDNWLRSVPLLPAAKTPTAKTKPGREDQAVIMAARPPTRRGEKPKAPGVQAGTLRLRFRDVSASDVATALEEPSQRLRHFRPAGLVSGTATAVWKGSPTNAEVTFAADANPSPSGSPGELPVTARIEGKYRGESDELQLAQFDLSTPASRVQATGTLGASSTLHVSISTGNLEEWQPLVVELGGPIKMPVRIDGHAAFNGVVGGTLSEPTLAGTLNAQDFDFTVPATSRTPEQPVHWDSLTASIQLSSHQLVVRGGSLRRGDTSADFDLTAMLQDGRFTETSPYNARVNLHNVDVASTAALAGFDHPVSGTAGLTLQISGTRQSPQVQGHIHAANASAYGEAIENFEADLAVDEGQTSLDDIHLTHEGAAVGGSASYTPATHAFRLNLAGKNFDLSHVRQVQLSRLPVEGHADFTLQGSGTLAAPAINAEVQVRDLTFNHETSGGLELQAATRNGELQLAGHSQFPQGTLLLEGDVGMHGDYPAKISARMDRVDLDGLWRAYLGGQLTGHSAVGGMVTLEGPLRYPRRWTLNGSLADLSINLEYTKLHNQDPVRFTYADQTLHIEPAHLTGAGTDVTGEGSIHFAGSKELDLAADGQIDLGLLGSLNKDITASGLMSIHMTVAGTLDQPLPQGSIQIKNGAANYAGLPSGLSEMNGSLAFTRDRISIEQLTARTGGGSLDFKGDATNYNRQVNFNVTAVGKEVRLRYPPGVSSTANAELHWVGTLSASTVSGDILVTKLAVTPGFDFGSYLEQSRQSVALAPANSPLYNVKLDVAVHTAPELQMKTAVARLSGDADLRLRGSVARPSVLGRADILEGDATFNGIKFRLERGDITFANPVAIEPQVNLQATTHVRNYDLDVTVTGTPERLAVNYRSEPPLPKSDIIALLALGRTSEESEQLQQQSGQTLFTDEATSMIINQALNSTVSSRLQKLFGVSRIKIDPQGLTTETNPTARGPQITIEQQFANNVSLTYSTNVAQSSEQIIEGEYFFTRNISGVGTRDQNGVVSFDVRVRQRKK